MSVQPLRQRVRDGVRADLVSGRLRPGEQIRVAPLANRLQVSLTPAREALTQLEAEGWVVLYPNRGFFAAPVKLMEAEALYPVLAGLEGLAVELQGSNLGRCLPDLRKLNHKMASSMADPDRAFECDRRWHEALVDGCANPLLLNHLQSIREHAERYERAYMRHSGRVPSSTEDHSRIIAAIEKAPHSVPLLIREHWNLSLDFLREWLVHEAGEEHGP